MSKERNAKGAMKKAGNIVTRKAAAVGGKKGAMGRKVDTDFRAAFMENIMIKRRELEKTLEHLLASQREYGGQLSGGDFIDEFDQAQREISASSRYPIIERKTKELKKIEHLINRISKEEKFGVCEECGKRIPKRRLLIVPEATLCVDCQRELERLDSHRGVEARLSNDFGGRNGMDWESPEDSDENGLTALKSGIDSFSIEDIRGTEAENHPEGQ